MTQKKLVTKRRANISTTKQSFVTLRNNGSYDNNISKKYKPHSVCDEYLDNKDKIETMNRQLQQKQRRKETNIGNGDYTSVKTYKMSSQTSQSSVRNNVKLRKSSLFRKIESGKNLPKSGFSGKKQSSKKSSTNRNFRGEYVVGKPTKMSSEEIAIKRAQKMEQVKNRRDKLHRDRKKYLHHNSGSIRQERIRKRTREEKNRKVRLLKLMVVIVLGVRIQAASRMIESYRQYKAQLVLEDNAARIITRQMKIMKFRLYRKRIKGAIKVIATIFLVKVRLWKDSRRRVASDRVTAFLLALEKDNHESGGSLALIVKGKKWRVYRLKIIILQRLWRERLRIISAQVMMVDEQWKQEQQRRMLSEVEIIYNKMEKEVSLENEQVDSLNRTRKLLKMHPLPKKTCDTREMITERLIKGEDFLSVGNIVPTEIRHGIIKEMLKHLRRMHRYQLILYESAYQKYEQDVVDRQRRRAILVGFSGNGELNTLVWGTRAAKSKTVEIKFRNDISYLPIKPKLHLILGEVALSTMLGLGQNYVNELRKMWNPFTMKILSLQYNGKEAAEAHFNENQSIIETNKRNQSILNGSSKT